MCGCLIITLNHQNFGLILGLARRRSINASITDLPTSKTCKSGDFEKKPRKTWILGPQTWRFPKYVLNENKKW